MHNHGPHHHFDKSINDLVPCGPVDCDLEEFLSSPHRPDTHCHMQYWGRRNIYCGCNMCTGRPWRRLSIRQQRVGWRQLRQDLLKASDVVDIDTWVPRGSAW